MATIVSKSYSDDLPGVTVAQEEGAEAKTLNESQRVTLTMTQGEHVYIVDTAQSSPLAALIRKAGTKQKKRGRKAGDAS